MRLKSKTIHGGCMKKTLVLMAILMVFAVNMMATTTKSTVTINQATINNNAADSLKIAAKLADPDEWELYYVLMSTDSLIVRFDIEFNDKREPIEGILVSFFKLKSQLLSKGWKETGLKPAREVTLYFDFGVINEKEPMMLGLRTPRSDLLFHAKDMWWVAKILPALLQ